MPRSIDRVRRASKVDGQLPASRFAKPHRDPSRDGRPRRLVQVFLDPPLSAVARA
jgi:hypothetical protein